MPDITSKFPRIFVVQSSYGCIWNISLINKQIPDEERVLEKLYVMSKEEQMSIQRMSNENGKQVMNQADS